MWPFTSSSPQGSTSQASVPPDGQPNSASASGSSASEAPAVCPVDHSTRAAWTSANALQAAPHSPASSTRESNEPAAPRGALSNARETSSIPRWSDAEGDQGAWVYPSPAQFYSAMTRKNQAPQARDMEIVVPIHNAVNERAWAQILQWEQGWDAQSKERCGGPKLVSFKGRPKDVTWRAWWKGLAGYAAPFDRHDWVIDRCGRKMRYIIDFYSGGSNSPAGNLSFYLDVRPAPDTVEGLQMRMARLFFGKGSSQPSQR